MPATFPVRTATQLLDQGLSPVDALVRATDRSALDPQEVAEAPLAGRALLTRWKELARVVQWDLAPGLLDAITGAQDPLALATAMIAAKHASLGGPGGLLGASTTAVTVCPDGVGYYRHFAGGSVYWHPGTGAHEVHGDLRAQWADLGWERSFLGYPTSDELPGRDPASAGRVSHFQGGSLYWYPGATSTRHVFEVHGAIRSRYLALGGEASVLGYPTTDETGTPDGVGRYNHFQAGSVYWTPSTGAHEVHGLIRALWAASGWERDPSLGYPLTDELVPDRRVGSRRPEATRKPVADLPVDVVKLPREVGPGFPRSVVNWSGELLQPRGDGRLPHVDVVVRPDLLHPTTTSPAAQASPHRFSDFEDGVLFWRRGAAAAERLTHWSTRMGDGPTLEAATVVDASRTALAAALGGRMTSVQLAGTTGYSWDGVAVHGRRHRLTVTLDGGSTGGSSGGGLFGGILDGLHHVLDGLTQVVLEVQVEVGLDPVHRKVTLCVVGWSPTSPGAQLAARQLHGALDPLLWQAQPPLVDLLHAHDDDPVAVLSVKVQRDGSVLVYLEPDTTIDLTVHEPLHVPVEHDLHDPLVDHLVDHRPGHLTTHVDPLGDRLTPLVDHLVDQPRPKRVRAPRPVR